MGWSMSTVNYYEIDGNDVHVRYVDRNHDFVPRVGDVMSFAYYPSHKLLKKNPEEWKRLSSSPNYPKCHAEVIAVEYQFHENDDDRVGTFTVNAHVRTISADEWGDRNEALGYQRGDDTLSKPFRDVLDAAKRKLRDE